MKKYFKKIYRSPKTQVTNTSRSKILGAINMIHNQIESEKIVKGTVQYNIAIKVIAKLTNEMNKPKQD